MQSNKRKAAIYCRVATASDFAMEKQRDSLRCFAAAEGYEISTEYLDNGAKGLSHDRPAFSRLNKDMQTGIVQTVFVKSVSRIGRDKPAVMEWLNMARSLGVDVISEYDDIDDCETLHKLMREIINLK